MAFKFPFTNYHELNLTWVLEQLKKLFEDSEENVETIEGYEDRLSAVEDELPVVEATADQAAQTANAAATLAQTAKSTADTANENALAASAQAGLARQEAAAAEAEAQAATQAAQIAQATAQNFDGRITQAEADASEALQEAQSFENRVNAAINTANNAANTATIAQGIAVNANQNAATALDTAQTADGKAEAAQDAADIADGKAEAAQDAADIADSKAEAAQDTADLADEKADQNAAKIGNLSDLTTTAKNNLVAAINEAAQTGGGTDDTKAPLIVSDASGAIASFSDGANNMQIQELVCNIEPLQTGTGDPSPTNVRPISGRNGMTVVRTGKNIASGEIVGYYINAQGTFSLDAQYKMVYGKVKQGVTYTILTDDGSVLVCGFFSEEPTTSSSSYNGQRYVQTSYTITSPIDGYIAFRTSSGYATPQLEIGSVSSSYAPYTSTTIPITWETEAGAVYGGTLDMITGKLTVTHAIVDLSTLVWGYSAGDTRFYSQSLANEKNILPNVLPDSKCSAYKVVTFEQFYNNPSVDDTISIYYDTYLFVRDLRFTSPTDFKNAISGVMFVYELAEPVEYTLTPHELTTLYGVNNIWTDVGAIQSCKYPADTKLYIDGKVAELQALILEN